MEISERTIYSDFLFRLSDCGRFVISGFSFPRVCYFPILLFSYFQWSSAEAARKMKKGQTLFSAPHPLNFVQFGTKFSAVTGNLAGELGADISNV